MLNSFRIIFMKLWKMMVEDAETKLMMREKERKLIEFY
jgi:hypothetical protein